MKHLILFGFAILLVVGCEIKKSEVSENNYFPLHIGNYWIYQHVDIDSSGNETVKGCLDSVVIVNETLINGTQYFVFEGLKLPNSTTRGIVDIVRDSSGFLVNADGTIIFSETNFADVLTTKVYVSGDDTLGSTTYKMQEMEERVSVPAGEFNALNFMGTVVSNHPIIGVENPRYLNNFYVDGVGKILSAYFYFSSPVISEKRLVRYYIN